MQSFATCVGISLFFAITLACGSTWPDWTAPSPESLAVDADAGTLREGPPRNDSRSRPPSELDASTVSNQDGGPPAVAMQDDTAILQVLGSEIQRAVSMMPTPGAVVALRDSVGKIHPVAGGFADARMSLPLAAGDRFQIGSVSELFGDTAALKLYEAGLLDIEAPLERFVPGIDRGSEITIRNLLQEDSGIFDYSYDSDLRLDQPHTVDSLIAVIRAHSAKFRPGTTWQYSASEPLLLARVVEIVTGQTYAQALRRLVIAPLGLNQTFFLPGESVPGRLVQGTWYDGAVFQDASMNIHPSVGWAAAGVISTVGDLAIFLAALGEGPFLSAPLRTAMQTKTRHANGVVPRGLGLDIWDGPNGPAYGTGGGFGDGFGGCAFYLPQPRLTLSALINVDGRDACDLLFRSLAAVTGK